MKPLLTALIALTTLAAGERVADLERQYREQIRELEPEGPTLALSDTLNGLAALYFQEGDFVRAEKLSQRALETEVASEAPRELEIARRLGNIGSALVAQGRYDRAVPLVRKSMETFERLGAAYEQAFALNTLGTMELRRKHADAALGYFRDAVRLWAGHPEDAARGKANVAAALTALGRAESLAAWTEALASAEAASISERERGVMLCGYADALASNGRKRESEKQRRQGREMMRTVAGLTVDRADFR